MHHIVETLQRCFHFSVPSYLSKDVSEKASRIARNVLKIGMVSAVAWSCRSINANATFFGFTLGSCFFYSPVREIMDGFSFSRLSDTASVAQAVMMLIGKLAPDLIPWGITFTVFATAATIGVYSRELITPNEHLRQEAPTEKILDRSSSFKTIMYPASSKDFISKITSIAFSSLVVFIKAFIPTLFNWTLSWYSPNVSPCGFLYGFVLHKFFNKQWEDIKKYSLNSNLLPVVGGVGIASIVYYPKKELAQKVSIFFLSAMMGKYTYSVMFKET